MDDDNDTSLPTIVAPSDPAPSSGTSTPRSLTPPSDAPDSSSSHLTASTVPSSPSSSAAPSLCDLSSALARPMLTTSRSMPAMTFRSVSFAPLPITEHKTSKRAGQLGVAARSRMLAERRMKREADGIAPPPPPSFPPPAAGETDGVPAQTMAVWAPPTATSAAMDELRAVRAPEDALRKLARGVLRSLTARSGAKSGSAAVSSSDGGGGGGGVVGPRTFIVHAPPANADEERGGRVWEEEVDPEFLARQLKLSARKGTSALPRGNAPPRVDLPSAPSPPPPPPLPVATA